MTDEINAEFEPVSKSESGKNAYYLDECKIVQHRPGYAKCLRIVLDNRNRQRTVLGCDSCHSAIGKGECIAVNMRKDEEVAGKALFYIDRTALQEEMAQQAEDALLRQASQPASRNTVRRAYRPELNDAPEKTYTSAPPVPKPMSLLDAATGGGDYAAAINMAIKTASVPTPTPKPIVTVQPSVAKAGMSMIEMARAALAAKSL